jgi:hypothetical protein
MTPSKERMERLERALARAHQLQDPPELSPNWVYSVMRDVRRQALAVRATAELPWLVWRAATVVVFVSVVVVVSVMAWNVEELDRPFASFFSETTVDPILL